MMCFLASVDIWACTSHQCCVFHSSLLSVCTHSLSSSWRHSITVSLPPLLGDFNLRAAECFHFSGTHLQTDHDERSVVNAHTHVRARTSVWDRTYQYDKNSRRGRLGRKGRCEMEKIKTLRRKISGFFSPQSEVFVNNAWWMTVHPWSRMTIRHKFQTKRGKIKVLIQ